MGPFGKRRRLACYATLVLSIGAQNVCRADAAPCEGIGAAEFPARDKPTPAQRAATQHASRDYYYGIGIPVDYIKARHAAFAELERNEGFVFGGGSVLMMLYANGFGVTRDLELAIRLACAFEGAPAEIEGRVAHLKAMRDGAPRSERFDICDDITSGFMEGHCTSLAEDRKRVTRDRKLAALVADWPAPQRASFERLKQAAESFWTAHANHEVDLSGTRRGAAVVEEEASLRSAFLTALSKFEQGQLPSGSEAEYRSSESQLNRVYKDTLKKDLSFAEITPDGIRATERAWIPYRDAWLAFGAARYPSVHAEAWKTWLNLIRTRQLRGLWF
jgi:hypothetical protein